MQLLQGPYKALEGLQCLIRLGQGLSRGLGQVPGRFLAGGLAQGLDSLAQGSGQGPNERLGQGL